MLNFAFIINTPAESRSCEKCFESSGQKNIITGADLTDGLDASIALVKELAGEGVTLFNLCGDFDEEMATELEKAADGIKVRNSKYTDEEAAKFDTLTEEQEAAYGVIVSDENVAETQTLVIPMPGFTTTVKFVKDMEAAKDAAKTMADEGIGFIELCSWFDKARCDEIIKAAGTLPVGTCGDL